jgi:hypothetical protein
MVRHTGIVSLAVVCIMAVVFVLACAIAPTWAKSAGLDVWNLPSLNDSVKEADAKSTVLMETQEQMRNEREFGDHLVTRLIDGTVTLAEASAEMEPIMQKRPGFDVVCRLDYRVTTSRQGAAKCLINRVNAVMNGDSRWPAISARLEAEFAALTK